jgi:predicted TIM-barrel fold metal-dependent hydrolase
MSLVIDCHVHYDGRDGELESLLEACDRIGIGKAVIFSMESNDAVLRAAHAHPDRLIPFAYFALGTDAPARVSEFRDAGFRGIKFINPKDAYNSRSYWDVYGRMAEAGLVAIYHLGIVGRRRDGQPDDHDSNLTRAIHLDHIARCFPTLRLIGAHFGNPWYEEAAMAARWNSNLWFDLSGSTLKAKPPEFIRALLWWDRPGHPYRPHGDKHPFDKILFGTDVAHEWMSDVHQDYQLLLAAMKVPPEYRAKIMGGTAMEILGITG